MSVANNATSGVFPCSAYGSDGAPAQEQQPGFDGLAARQEPHYLSGGTLTFKAENLPLGCRDVPKSQKSPDDLLDDVSYHGSCSFYAEDIDKAIEREEAKGHQVKDITIVVSAGRDFQTPRPASNDDAKWTGTEWERTPHALALTVGHNIRRNIGRSHIREHGRLPTYRYGEVLATKGNPGEWSFSHKLYSEFRPELHRHDTAMRQVEADSGMAAEPIRKKKRPRPVTIPKGGMA